MSTPRTAVAPAVLEFMRATLAAHDSDYPVTVADLTIPDGAALLLSLRDATAKLERQNVSLATHLRSMRELIATLEVQLQIAPTVEAAIRAQNSPAPARKALPATPAPAPATDEPIRMPTHSAREHLRTIAGSDETGGVRATLRRSDKFALLRTFGARKHGEAWRITSDVTMLGWLAAEVDGSTRYDAIIGGADVQALLAS